MFRAFSGAALLGCSAVWAFEEEIVGLFGPTADTEHGKVEGVTRVTGLGDRNVDAFLGIPFAAPPVGDKRFRPPQPFLDSWAPKTRHAKLPPQVCDQLDIAGNLHIGDEDCLYLNVYRPAGAKAGANLPVFVWIYGGGYFIGDGIEFSVYDGTHVVKKHEYVIVTMNYRLSGFGFFALPELAAEDSDGTTGNYGVQDQRAAMQWVQRNIKNFGGNPDMVTIAGESAGAFSVTYHTVAPASRGLFHAAIMESGTSHLSWFFQNKTEAFEFYDEWSAILGCPNDSNRLACLRKVKAHHFVISFAQMAKDIIARILPVGGLPSDIPDFASPLWPLMPFGPAIDGTDTGLPDVPLTLIQKGEFAKVPLIIGANKDGGHYFGPIIPLLWGDVPGHYEFDHLAKWFLPDAADQQRAVELYSDISFRNDRLRMDRFMRDVTFQCSNREVATAWSNAGLPTYLYTFSFDFKGKAYDMLGDAHAFELPFVWRNYAEVLGFISAAGSAAEYENMANVMSCTWASFVSCHAPKCQTNPPHCDATLSAMPEWPSFATSSNRSYMSLKGQSTVESVQKGPLAYEEDEFPGDDRCDFWASANMDWQNIRKSVNSAWLGSTQKQVAV